MAALVVYLVAYAAWLYDQWWLSQEIFAVPMLRLCSLPQARGEQSSFSGPS